MEASSKAHARHREPKSPSPEPIPEGSARAEPGGQPDGEGARRSSSSSALGLDWGGLGPERGPPGPRLRLRLWGYRRYRGLTGPRGLLTWRGQRLLDHVQQGLGLQGCLQLLLQRVGPPLGLVQGAQLRLLLPRVLLLLLLQGQALLLDGQVLLQQPVPVLGLVHVLQQLLGGQAGAVAARVLHLCPRAPS